MSEQYWAMGGYSGFVWPAYGLTLVALFWMLFRSIYSAKHNEMLLKRARDRR